MKHQYSVQIIWSEEDRAYIAAPYELPGCAADGQTPEEALANLRVVIDEWIEVATEEGREVPPPVSREDLERNSNKQQQEFKKHIEGEVRNAVLQILKQLASVPAQQSNFTLSQFSRYDLEPAGFGRR